MAKHSSRLGGPSAIYSWSTVSESLTRPTRASGCPEGTHKPEGVLTALDAVHARAIAGGVVEVVGEREVGFAGPQCGQGVGRLELVDANGGPWQWSGKLFH